MGAGNTNRQSLHEQITSFQPSKIINRVRVHQSHRFHCAMELWAQNACEPASSPGDCQIIHCKFDGALPHTLNQQSTTWPLTLNLVSIFLTAFFCSCLCVSPSLSLKDAGTKLAKQLDDLGCHAVTLLSSQANQLIKLPESRDFKPICGRIWTFRPFMYHLHCAGTCAQIFSSGQPRRFPFLSRCCDHFGELYCDHFLSSSEKKWY